MSTHSDQTVEELDSLIKNFVPETFGMKDKAPWDSYFLMAKDAVTYDMWIAWHFGCFFADEDPEK